MGRPYTERFLSSLMGLISIFLRPIVKVAAELRRRRCQGYTWVDSKCGLPPTEVKHQQPTVSVVKLVACAVAPRQRGAPEQCAALV